MRTSATGRVENFFAQINKTVKQIFITIRDIFLSLPSLLFNFFGNPGPLISIVEVILLGLAWIWLGDFLLRHITLLKIILKTLNDVASAVSFLFGVFGDSVELAFDVLASAGNLLGDGINDIASFFGGGNPIPKIPTIPLTRFPILDFDGFIASLDDFDSAATCIPFKELFYEVVFPLRYGLNDKVCPVVRYMTGTIVYPPFAWLLSIFYFNADPNDPQGNCVSSESRILCYVLRFGYILVYIFAPCMAAHWLWPALKNVILSSIKLAKDILGLFLETIIDFLHTAFHKSETRKKKN